MRVPFDVIDVSKDFIFDGVALVLESWLRVRAPVQLTAEPKQHSISAFFAKAVPKSESKHGNTKACRRHIEDRRK